MAKKNTTDSRSTHTDALATLGTIIGPNEKRDAIHLATIPVIAKTTVYPGQHVDKEGNPTNTKNSVGIVDPFLTQTVYPGSWFWLIIKPRTITSLRHVWVHPDFPDELEVPAHKNVSASEQYIRDLAESVGISYQRLIDAARSYLRYGEYITGGAEMEGAHVPDEFWVHYENVTGEIVTEADRGSFFSCSC
jgi:hypothetical protein